MKRSFFFIFSAIFFLFSFAVNAQQFFMPASELKPYYEKLPPVPGNFQPQNVQKNSPQFSARFIAVDGRFIPIIDNDEPIVDLSAPILDEGSEELSSDVPVDTQTSDAQPVLTAEKISTPEPVFETIYTINAPKTDPIDDSLPSFRNRYAQYLNDLVIFRQNGVMPENLELETILAKMNANDYHVIYREKLN